MSDEQQSLQGGVQASWARNCKRVAAAGLALARRNRFDSRNPSTLSSRASAPQSNLPRTCACTKTICHLRAVPLQENLA